MKILVPAILAAILFLPLQTTAESPEEKGLAIALEIDQRGTGFGDCILDTVMILRNRQGREHQRLMRSQVLETQQDGDKSVTIFDSPGDVRGTALLTYSHKSGDDDQWLYLPALKRVKRISSSNKSGAFMGSEFAYEDMGSREVEKYRYRYIRDEQINDQNGFVLELYPRDRKNSGYSRIVSWVDKVEYRVHKEEYYDKKERLLKTLLLSEYHQYLDFLWRAHLLKMVNHQNGKETDLVQSNFTFQTGLSDRDFTKNSLKRSK